VLGCSAKAVEMRIYKARQILRGKLQEFLAG
jgi:DNA-directed RNA polymerase specialized sigma24 family protein